MRLQSFHSAKITTVTLALSTVALLLLSVAVASPTTSMEGTSYLPTVNNAYAATDTTDPTVTITKPIGYLTTDTMIVRGTAFDNSGGSMVKTVEVKVDGDSDTYKKATPRATGDWSTWSVTISLSNGPHTLTARATDNAGNENWDTVSIFIDTKEPSVTITKPSGTISDDTMIVRGTAFDNSGGSKVKTVEVKVDSGTYKTATPRATGDWSTWSVTVSIPSLGPHTLTARATDKAGNENWDTSDISITSAITDKFGIKKIYDTQSSGREWFMDMDDPTSDGIFSTGSTQWTLADIDKNSDGSWRVSGKEYPSSYRYQVRMIVETPPGEKEWKNVEWTAYLRPIKTFAKESYMENDLVNSLILYARGGIHSGTDPCAGTAMKGSITLGGETYFQKEVWHSGGYAHSVATKETITPLLTQKDSSGHYYGGNKWIGIKVVMYNIDYSTKVKMEIWLDKMANNVWEKVNEYTDTGNWNADRSDFWDAGCRDADGDLKQRDHLINYSGPWATLRTDNIEFDFKNLSIREIQAP